MTGQSDELIQRACEGDRAAVNALIERYWPDVHAFVRLRAGALVRSRESTSDVVQSVCREALQHIERFKYPSEGAFKRWLFATALRKIIDRKKHYLAGKRDVLREVEVSEGDAEALWQRYRSFSTPSRRLMVREEIERVERAFEDLSDSDREIITLAHIVGLSRKEIAEQLGKEEGAVRVQLFRALAKVSERLSD